MKKVMFIFMGIVIGIIGTSYAAYKLTAKEVSFDKTNTNLNSNDVQGAIDEIYEKFKTIDEFKGEMILSCYESYNAVNYINVQGYKNITFSYISNLFTGIISLQTEDGAIIENNVVINQVYDISNYNKIKIVIMEKGKSWSGNAKYTLSK